LKKSHETTVHFVHPYTNVINNIIEKVILITIKVKTRLKDFLLC